MWYSMLSLSKLYFTKYQLFNMNFVIIKRHLTNANRLRSVPLFSVAVYGGGPHQPEAGQAEKHDPRFIPRHHLHTVFYGGHGTAGLCVRK